MAELNRTAITDAEWKAFLSDIEKVQKEHNILLVPSFKLSPVTGMTVEWGGIRKPSQDNGDVSKAEAA